MFRILLSILFCFLLTTQCCAKDILLKRCQDDRIVLIIGVADKNHIAYGHGFIVGKNKLGRKCNLHKEGSEESEKCFDCIFAEGWEKALNKMTEAIERME